MERRPRRRRYSRKQAPLGPKIRLILAMALVFGGLFPVAAAPKYEFRGNAPHLRGYEYFFTWEGFKPLGEAEAFSTQWLSIMFIVVTPFLGLAALALLFFARRIRSMVYVTLGAIPAGLIIAAMGGQIMSGQGWFMGPIGIVASALLVTGAIVALQRPHREIGFRLCALAGAVTLALALLPLTPDPTIPGKNTSAFLVIIKVLEIERIGMIIFALAMTGMAANAIAVTVFSGRGRARRARWVLILVAVYYGMLLALPMFAPLIMEAPALPVFILTMAFVGLRILPALGLLVYGITDLILLNVPEHTETDPDVFA